MEDSHATTGSGALGARFKAGLQSVLNTLGKTNAGQSPEKQSRKMLEPDTQLLNGHIHNGVSQQEKRDVCNGDAILGESENDEEDMVINESDDALLEGADTGDDSNSIAESGDSNVLGNSQIDPKQSIDPDKRELVQNGLSDSVTTLPTDPCKITNSLRSEPAVTNGCSDQQQMEIDSGKVEDCESMSESNDISVFKSPSCMSVATTTSESSILSFNEHPQAKEMSETTPKKEKVLGLDDKKFTTEKSGLKVVCEEKAESQIQVSSSSTTALGTHSTVIAASEKHVIKDLLDNKCKLDSTSESEEVKAKTVTELSSVNDNQINNTHDEPKVTDEACNTTSGTTLSDSNKMCENDDMNTERSSPGSDALLSPEENRGDKSVEVISPPSMSVDNSIISASPSSNSNSLIISGKDAKLDDDMQSPPEVKQTMTKLLNQTVANVDKNVASKSCKREELSSASLGSSRNADKAASDKVSGAEQVVYVGDSSDEEVDCLPSKRAKLSSAPVEPEDRLNKLISHLSTTLDVPSSQTEYHEEMDEDDGLESIQLKKNGLASFYDAIIKSDVVKDAYHEELSQKHEELQIKNNMDCKKIQKILHEVKTVREKLKQMNIRPAQRSVSTQICTEKLQVAPDQPGNRIMKSKVLSQKALAEQHKAAEAKRQLAASAKAKYDWQLKQQAEANAKRLADQAARQRSEEMARMAAARAKEQEKAKASSCLKPPSKPPPVTSTPKASTSAGNEVIDLTAEEDSTKPTEKATAATTNGNSSAPPVAKANAPSPAAGVALPSQLAHPAPLPPCPLTGHSGHLLKPNAPRLELSSKEDGIVLQWNMAMTKSHAKVATYQIFGYKERPGPLSGFEWKKVGDLKALPLPMACTLTQFQTGHTYHFAVRAVDELGRTGPFGTPRSTKLG